MFECMCGRLNVTDDPFVVGLLIDLGIDLGIDITKLPEREERKPRYGRFKKVCSNISIVREINGKRQLDDAFWWLLFEPTEDGFKPSKYTSFNTRYDKLNKPRSAGYKSYREKRCVIVASGFGETMGKGKDAVYHDFIAVDSAIAFGGLYREWYHQGTGESLLSCSVITLPPHEKIKPYHKQASPLMLPQRDDTIDMWLDSSFQNVEAFDDLLKPNIPQDLSVHRIDKPSTFNQIGDTFIINADAK